MERMAIHVVRILERFLYDINNIINYSGLLVLSSACAIGIIKSPLISELLSAFDSIFAIFIIYIFTFLIFVICCSAYIYIKFIKYSREMILRVFFFFLIVYAALYVLKQLDGYELAGSSLPELFEYIRFVLVMMGATLVMFGLLIGFSLLGQRMGHKMNMPFKVACSAIKRLEKIQNNEMNNYKDLYTIHRVSVEYTRGIREIKNLLIRGIDPNGFFDSNTELSLNEILDLLTFSMQYYLFYGGPEQMEAVKTHLECMRKNFDEEYHINANQFIHETLRMYNKMDIYFKENNIFIARSTKFTDRVMGYLPQALLAIILLVISILIKNYTLN